MDNVSRYLGQFAPELLRARYGKEIWALYEKGKLTPHSELTGKFRDSSKEANVNEVLSVIADAREEHEIRMERKNPQADSKPKYDRRREGPPVDMQQKEKRRENFSGKPKKQVEGNKAPAQQAPVKPTHKWGRRPRRG